MSAVRFIGPGNPRRMQQPTATIFPLSFESSPNLFRIPVEDPLDAALIKIYDERGWPQTVAPAVTYVNFAPSSPNTSYTWTPAPINGTPSQSNPLLELIIDKRQLQPHINTLSTVDQIISSLDESSDSQSLFSSQSPQPHQYEADLHSSPTSTSTIDPTEEQRRKQQRSRNAAQRSRLKRQEETKRMRQRSEEIEKENAQLEQKMEKMRRQIQQLEAILEHHRQVDGCCRVQETLSWCDLDLELDLGLELD